MDRSFTSTPTPTVSPSLTACTGTRVATDFPSSISDSSNYKISTYDLSRPEAGFKDLVKHDPNSLLSSAHVASRDKLCLLCKFFSVSTAQEINFALNLDSVDVKDSLYLHSLSTGARIEQIDEGLIGSIGNSLLNHSSCT
jgi:prolyl oligopeptidase